MWRLLRARPRAQAKPRRRLLSPLVLALSLLLFLVFGLTLGRQWYDSLLARLDYGQLVHRDQSALDTGVRAQVPPRVALTYRERDGETVRVLVDAARYSAFVEAYSRNLEAMVEARTAQLRESEASLLALKNHLSTVIANVGTGVFSLDAAGLIEAFNGRAGEIFGVPPSEAHGRSLEEALGGAETSHLVEVVADVQDGRLPRREAQVLCRLPQGRRTLSVVASALFGEGRRPIGTVVVCEDLTQLLASQRLEAWKEAVERVIHEIKNPLTPIQLSAEHVTRLLTDRGVLPAPEIDSCLDTIFKQVRTLYDIAEVTDVVDMLGIGNDPPGLVEEYLHGAARVGDRKDALEMSRRLAEVDEPFTMGQPSYLRASIAAQLGERDEAIRLLQQAVSRGFSRWGSFHVDTAFEPLRDDPEFQEIIRPKG